jgi:hypothetical protein
MAVNVKIIFFWDIVPHNLAEIDRCFRDAYCLHHQGALMEDRHVDIWV